MSNRTLRTVSICVISALSIPLGACWAAGASAPTPDAVRAQQIKDLRFGMFICWSFSTFSGHEWTRGVTDPVYFKATGCDTDQWCETARDAGMGYILFLTKHHDGFCLWDTDTTEFKVTNSPLGIDVLAKLRKSCDKYGIRLALYFSEGDWTWIKEPVPQDGLVPGSKNWGNRIWRSGQNAELKKKQLEELCTRYGPIEFFWMDHAQSDGGLGHAATAEWVRRFQPDCFVGFNHGEPAGRLCLRERGRPGPIGDAAASKYNKDAEQAYKGYLAAEFTYPILPPHEGGAQWFYSLPKHDALCFSAQTIYEDYLGAVKYGNIFSLDAGPDYAGRLRPIDVQTLKMVGAMIRNGSDPGFFPVVTQFSPVPSGKGWKGEEGPLSEETIRDTIDNMRAHGVTGIEAPTRRPPEEEAKILEYAQSKGMIVSHHTGALELFGRQAPPGTCVYSEAYPKAVRANAEKLMAPLKNIPRLHSAFTYQDEPFHWGPKSFGYNEEVKAEFKKRYGYDLPPDLDSIRTDPRKWLDVINFRSDYFPDGWRQVYEIVKDINPDFKVILTHDSHNTFGAGCTSHSELAIDDVFHWGGDFADMFIFDLYPYVMFDFRFGEVSKLEKPRISQTHYTLAQMRNLTRAYEKDLGFWVGTYNPAWFKPYICPELAALYWSEREMSMTAVAQGSDYLITGYKVPIDAKHWDAFGEGLRLIQKAGARLHDAPKVKAKACMLFPRTQQIQLQHEYFNVGLSYELFLRAFGELDILHEEQVIDDTIDGYEILVLFDVELLPEKVAQHIANFVSKGGLVVADCVPRLNEYKEPMPILEDLFGVKDMKSDRIARSRHWVPYKDRASVWANSPANPPDESVFTTDAVRGEALGVKLDLPLISPRPSTVTGAEVLIKTAAGTPCLMDKKVGEGRAMILGFCVQDTYFRTWQTPDKPARDQLRNLLAAMAASTGLKAHVQSSNPDIEASVRANSSEGFLFVINHEAEAPETTVRVGDLGFAIKRIVNLADGQPVEFSSEESGAVVLKRSVAVGEVEILHLLP